MAGEFYIVTVGGIYLTDSGLVGGNPCLVKVDGLAKLFGAYRGVTSIPVTGRPFNFIAENEGSGVRLISKPFALKQATLASLKTIVDAANAAGTPITAVISGGPGSQTMLCDPLFENGQEPLDFGENFYEDDLYDTQIRLVTRGYA